MYVFIRATDLTFSFDFFFFSMRVKKGSCSFPFVPLSAHDLADTIEKTRGREEEQDDDDEEEGGDDKCGMDTDASGVGGFFFGRRRRRRRRRRGRMIGGGTRSLSKTLQLNATER